MAVRIRVYPAGMNAGTLGVNGYGGAVSAATYYNSKLASTKQVANLQLGYERALADERVERARLEERLKNPYLQANSLGALGGLGTLGALGGIGTLGTLGVLGGSIGTAGMTSMLPLLASGGGQTNVTNQSSTSAGTQTVTNSNVNNVSSVQQPLMTGGWGYPATPFGSGGLISGLLGALI